MNLVIFTSHTGKSTSKLSYKLYHVLLRYVYNYRVLSFMVRRINNGKEDITFKAIQNILRRHIRNLFDLRRKNSVVFGAQILIVLWDARFL